MSQRSQEPASTSSRIQITPRYVITAVVVVLMAVFIAENTNDVKVRLIAPHVTMPLWLLIAATFILGVVVGYLLQQRRARGSR